MESIFINEDTTESDPQSKGPRLFSTTGSVNAEHKKSINNELGEYFFAQEPEIRMPVVISDGIFSKDI